jgi:hypothetical protein
LPKQNSAVIHPLVLPVCLVCTWLIHQPWWWRQQILRSAGKLPDYVAPHNRRLQAS